MPRSPDPSTLTYPADAMQRVADRLCDMDVMLSQDDARDVAFDIVVDVTQAVDKLRAQPVDALRKLWDSLGSMERHHTPKNVCDAVTAALEQA